MMYMVELVLLLLALFAVCAEGAKYEIYKEALPWDDAREACLRDNRRLVQVTTEIEHDRIRYFRYGIYDNFWIGLREVGNKFQWTEDEVVRFTAWGQGQPNRQDKCVMYSTSDFMWQTDNCSSSLFFMCESNAPGPKISGEETMITGLLIGFGSMLGLLLLGILFLQMPCCRTSTVKAIGHFGLGRR